MIAVREDYLRQLENAPVEYDQELRSLVTEEEEEAIQTPRATALLASETLNGRHPNLRLDYKTRSILFQELCDGSFELRIVSFSGACRIVHHPNVGVDLCRF